MKKVKVTPKFTEILIMSREIERKWFIYNHNSVKGPFERVEILNKMTEGELKPTDLVWSRGHKEWQKLDSWRHVQGLHQDIWYINDNGHNRGPIGMDTVLSEIKQQRISPYGKLWTSGLTKWISYYDVAQISETLNLARRKHPRAPFVGKVQIDGIAEGINLAAHTISSGGLGLKGLRNIKVGHEMNMSIESPLLKGAVYAKAKVVYQNDYDCGLTFTTISPENLSVIADYIQQFEI